MNEVEYCHVKDYRCPQLAPTNPGNDYGAYKGSAQNHNYVIQNVVRVLSKRMYNHQCAGRVKGCGYYSTYLCLKG